MRSNDDDKVVAGMTTSKVVSGMMIVKDTYSQLSKEVR